MMNVIGGSLDALFLARHEKSRAINAENPTGEKRKRRDEFRPAGTVKKRQSEFEKKSKAMRRSLWPRSKARGSYATYG